MTEPSLRCDQCAIRHRAVCGALTRPEIERLNAIAHHKRLPPGQVILADNEQPNYFANIISGVVKLTKSLEDGREQIVGLQFATDFLGRPYRARSPYRAEAVTDVHLCTYDRPRFEKLASEWPEFQRRLFSHTLDELDAAQEWMLLLGRKTAEERVASFLLMVANRMKSVGCNQHEQDAISFDLPLTRAEIADFLGLTIETVSRQFTRLKLAKILTLEASRSISIRDMNRLRAVSAHSAV
jgi:CRP/FNR family transcriptional regulator, anaerobic regulatory protein